MFSKPHAHRGGRRTHSASALLLVQLTAATASGTHRRAPNRPLKVVLGERRPEVRTAVTVKGAVPGNWKIRVQVGLDNSKLDMLGTVLSFNPKKTHQKHCCF